MWAVIVFDKENPRTLFGNFRGKQLRAGRVYHGFETNTDAYEWCRNYESMMKDVETQVIFV